MENEPANRDNFLESAELYDAIYHFKNYRQESERLRDLIGRFLPGARTLLDVACGTGEHARFLRDYYSVDGIDLNSSYLEAARAKNPAGRYVRADMTNFDLGRNYDVVSCLFSAIGYVKYIQPLQRAIRCMARHVRPGGVLLVEPWFTPERWQAGTVSANSGKTADGIVCRMALGGREDSRSVISLHYLYGTRQSIRYYDDRLELGLFTRDEMTDSLESAGMRVFYDPEGLIGRGLYIAMPRAQGEGGSDP